MTAPWYAHLVTGAVVIGAGLALAHMGDLMAGTTLVGSGATFLGVGSGAALVAPAAPLVAPTVKGP